ncbi:MAG: metal-dependent hydrolase [Microthrixaceae bacterium]|nr:metal-dependent hydrolase [Microthrixaceae bacterium]MCO5320619.1 metal-dependent hydrolase [Microthrixaceae bacterium]
MSVTEVDQSARSDSFPEGIAMQPREYSFEDLDAIPKYWNLDNPVLTHFENAFSIMIPPGERFFIDSVRAYEDRVTDDEGRALIEAFVRQEGLHGEAHDRFNASYERYGIDIARQEAYAAKVFRRARRWLPAKIQLGITVFSEHLTAVGAHTLLDAPEVEDEIDPQMLSFWRWHAAEELEHKSVAFDLFHRVGGGYATRMLSVLAAALFLAVPMVRITRALLREDPHQATAADRKQALAVQRRMGRRQLPLFLAYFKPGFHPWQIDDSGMLREWYRQGSLAQAS